MTTPKFEFKRKEILTAANGLTLSRIVGTIWLLFLETLSPLFLVIYTLTGLTDAFDGWVARKTGTASDFGARLDSVADLLFYFTMLAKFVPVLWVTIPRAIWFAAAAILLIRIGAYITAAVKYHRFASQHTYLNKATGAAAFLVPYMLLFPFGGEYCWVVCALAFVASVEELIIHIMSKNYNADRKSIFQRKQKPQNEQ